MKLVSFKLLSILFFTSCLCYQVYSWWWEVWRGAQRRGDGRKPLSLHTQTVHLVCHNNLKGTDTDAVQRNPSLRPLRRSWWSFTAVELWHFFFWLIISKFTSSDADSKLHLVRVSVTATGMKWLMAAVTDSGVKLWFKYDSRTQLQDDVCREQAAGLMCVCVCL